MRIWVVHSYSSSSAPRHFSSRQPELGPPQNGPASPIVERLGCKLVETPMGTQVWTSGTKETAISGAFACGDVARVPRTLSLAVADGTTAGAQLHRSLVWLDGQANADVRFWPEAGGTRTWGAAQPIAAADRNPAMRGVGG